MQTSETYVYFPYPVFSVKHQNKNPTNPSHHKKKKKQNQKPNPNKKIPTKINKIQTISHC